MSVSEMSFQKDVDNVAIKLKDVPTSMRIFSLCMRVLYEEKAVSGTSDTTRKINKLRDNTLEDALIYSKAVLPVSTKLVRILKEFFEYYYEGLEFDEWKECLSDIVEEVKGYKQCCTEVISLNEKIMITLKKRQDEAKVLMKEPDYLTNELRKRTKQLEESASSKRAWAIGLAFVPVVNAIATPLLCKGAESDMVKAVADGAECNVNDAAVAVVSGTMIPALSEFIKGLECIAGFFKIVEEEITTFQTKGEKAMENAKKLHYKMMKIKSKEIKQSCMEIFAVIPAVRTDLDCIPKPGTDQNYIDRWLKEQQEEIQKKYASSLSNPLKSMLKYFSSVSQVEKLMVEGKK